MQLMDPSLLHMSGHSLLDVTQVSEFYLLPGDGASHTKSMLYERGADYICSNAVQKYYPPSYFS